MPGRLELGPEGLIGKLDVPRGGIKSWVKIWILSRVSGPYLKMKTLETFVSILCMKEKKLKENLAKYGFITNSSS